MITGRSPTSPGAEIHDDFLRHVVLVYDAPYYPDPARFDHAGHLLDQYPELVDISLHAACAAGDTDRVRRWLDESPELLDASGGPHGWEPLLYACYARLPGASTLDVARCLIERSANPDAFHMANGQYRFTALTGVFGEGEAGPRRQPGHPDVEALARLLLGAGAHPNDSQAAYNRMFTPDDTCLALLLEYGLSAEHRNNWWLREGGELVAHPDGTLHYQLAWAVRHGMLSRVQLLVEHGADVNVIDDGRSMLEWSLLHGYENVADYLHRHGAALVELSPMDRFRQACLSADRAKAMSMCAERPELVQAASEAHPDMLHAAAGADKLDAVSLMIELGFDVNRQLHNVPLHAAAWAGHLDMVKLLIEHGADPTRRDHDYFSPPIGHAIHNDQQTVADYLDTCRLDIFSAVARGKIDVIDALIGSDVRQLDLRFGALRPHPDKPCDMDWMTPLAFAVVMDRLDCVDFLLSRGASIVVAREDGTSLIDVAREHSTQAIVSRLEAC